MKARAKADPSGHWTLALIHTDVTPPSVTTRDASKRADAYTSSPERQGTRLISRGRVQINAPLNAVIVR